MRFRCIMAGVAATLAAGVPLVTTSPATAQSWDTATLTVTIRTPAGVPTHVIVIGRGRNGWPGQTVVVGKAPKGTSTTQSRQVAADRYRVELPDFQWQGAHYVSWTPYSEVKARPSQRTDVTVVVVPDGGARDLHVTGRGAASAKLDWNGPSDGRYVLRRTEGPTPADELRDGVAVPTRGRRATDSHLTPGTQYSYALFTKGERGWAGPVTAFTPTWTTTPSWTPTPPSAPVR